MNEFITKYLAEILEKFKLKNPKVYGAVVVVLLVAIYFAQQGTAFGIFTVSPLVADLIQWASVILGMLFSSQTFPFLSPESKDKRPPLSS